MTPPYPPQQPGWQPGPAQQQGWNQAPPNYPNQPPQNWQQPPQQPYGQQTFLPTQQPRSASPVIAGILAILVGLGYIIYEFVEPTAIAGTIFNSVQALVPIVGGVLLILRKRSGIPLANAGGISMLYFAIYVTVDALIDMDFDDGAYFTIPLLLLIIASLVVNNLKSTRLSCTSWEGRNFAAPPVQPTLPAIMALAIGAILLIVTVGDIIYGVFEPSVIASIIGILLLLGGGALLIKRQIAGQVLTAFGAGIFIGPGSINMLYEVFGLSSSSYIPILALKVILGIVLAVLIAMPSVDRAVMIKSQSAPGQFPTHSPAGQFPPGWNQGAQPGQFPPSQQQPPPGWPQQPPWPPQR